MEMVREEIARNCVPVAQLARGAVTCSEVVDDGKAMWVAQRCIDSSALNLIVGCHMAIQPPIVSSLNKY